MSKENRRACRAGGSGADATPARSITSSASLEAEGPASQRPRQSGKTGGLPDRTRPANDALPMLPLPPFLCGKIASLKLRYLAQIPRHRMWMVLAGAAVVVAVA